MNERWVEISTGVEVKTFKNPEGKWSCDGIAWFPDLMAAYESARQAGTLIVKGDDSQDGFSAWVLAFLKELQALDPGASIKVTRLGNEFTTTREQAVLPPLRASELKELDLRLENEGDQGQG